MTPTTTADAMRGASELHRRGHLADAERIYQAVLRLDARNFDALHLLGAIRIQQGRYEEAVDLIRAALRLKPRNAAAWGNLGSALSALARHDEALSSYRRALALKPDSAELHSNVGDTLNAAGRHLEAVASCRRALAIDPRRAEAHNNLGNALCALGRHDEAIDNYQAALALRPEYAEALGNLGCVLGAIGRLDEAIAAHRQAVAHRPGHAPAHTNLGQALACLNRYDEAIASYEQAVVLAPESAAAHWNLGLALLALGDLARGWREYEWRWRMNGFEKGRLRIAQPPWLGKDDIAGRTVLLHAEQGYGDTMQFLRYAPLAARAGARVVLQVPKSLVPLAGGLEGVHEVVAQDAELPAFDRHCPLMSLPLAFGTRLETIPAEVPYLRVPDDAAAKSKSLPDAGLRVGLAWSGRRSHPQDRARSIALESLRPLLQRPGVRFVVLQKDLRDGDAQTLAGIPGLYSVADLDFPDVAAAVSLLDLVITVDTAFAHLAGALGVPVWVLLQYAPDWRWLLARDDSPWYPTARLFRQTRPGDWQGVIARVGDALAEQIRVGSRGVTRA